MKGGEAAVRRLAVALHPARLIVAATAAVAVAATSIATMVIAGRLGAGEAALARVVGGIICLNTLLFFPPGTLWTRPRRLLPILVANVFPMVAVAWLARREPLLAQVVLVAATGGVVLTRSWGALPAAGGLTVVVNVLVALLLGGAAGFPTIAAVAGVAGTVIAFAADALTWAVLRQVGKTFEQGLLAAAVAEFVAEAGGRWAEPGGWDEAWYAAHAARFAGIVEDLGLAGGAIDALVTHHLIRGIGRCGSRLAEARDALGEDAWAAIGRSMSALGQAFRSGLAGEEIAEGILVRLRVGLLALPEGGERRDRAVGGAVGLTLLLEELACAVLRPGPAGVAPRRAGFPVHAMEVRLALQAMACVAIATVVAHLLPAERPYWIPLTAVMLTCASFGETVRKSFERLLGTVGGLIAGELLWFALAGHGFLLAGVTLFSVGAIVFGRAGAYRWVLFWITLVLSLLLNAASEGGLLVGGRLLDTLIGAVIVLVVTRFVLPVRARATAAARVCALFGAVARRLRDVLAGRTESGLHTEIDAVLGSLSVASDAELLEAGLRRRARERVARRLDAAERIAGAMLSFAALPADFRPGPESGAGFAATAAMAAAAEEGGAPPAMPDIAAHERALLEQIRLDRAGEAVRGPGHPLGEATGDVSGHAQAARGRVDAPAVSASMRLELRALAVLAVLAEAIAALAATIGMERH